MILLFFQVQGTLQGGAKVAASGAAPPPTLLAVVVAPATTSIAVGATATFTATGTYSNASSSDVTSLCTWSSSAPAVATIGAMSNPQVVNGVSSGSTGITCAVGSVTYTSQLTVTGLSVTGPAPFPAATEAAAFTATFTASGGAPPYTFSITTGLSGLTGVGLSFTSPTLSGMLNASTVGTYGFTVTVHDSGSLTATRNFALVIGAVGGLRRMPFLPQVWANPHEADLPSPCDVAHKCYTKYIHTDGSGDYPCTIAGLQASMDDWAAAPNDVWWHVIVDDALAIATGGQCIIDTGNGWLLRAKTTGVASAFIIYESAHPNATGQTVCNHMKAITAIGMSPRNDSCATTPGIDDLAHMWKLTSKSTSTVHGPIFNAAMQINAGGYGASHIVIRDMEGIHTAFNAASNIVSTLACTGATSAGTGVCAPGTWNMQTGITTHIGIERCYIHGNFDDLGFSPTGSIVINAIVIGCAMCWVEWNYVDRISRNSPVGIGGCTANSLANCTTEGHGLVTTNAWYGVKIAHNYIEGAEITFLSGGGIPWGTFGNNPRDLEIRNNVWTMNPAWMQVKPGLPVNDWKNCRLGKKNVFEFKNAKRALVDGNLMENSIACGQYGQVFIFNSSDSDSQGNAFTNIQDVTITNNVLRHAVNGRQGTVRTNTSMGGVPRRWKFDNNLFYDINSCCGRTGGTSNVFQASSNPTSNFQCSGIRDTAGAVSTLTCISSRYANPTYDIERSQIEAGDLVQVSNCAPESSSFSTGPFGNTTTLSPMGVTALPGTNGMEPQGFTIVYPNPGPPNEVTVGAVYRVNALERNNNVVTIHYTPLPNTASPPITVGQNVRVLGLYPNSGYTSGPTEVTGAGSGTFTYARTGGNLALTPQTSGLVFVGGIGEAGCSLRAMKGWPQGAVTTHNTYVVQGGTNMVHYAMGLNCQTGGGQAQANTFQDEIFVNLNNNWTFTACAKTGSTAQAWAFDLSTLVFNHLYFTNLTNAGSLTMRSYPGPPGAEADGYARTDPNAFIWVAPGGGIASGVGCTGATADANCLGWNGMMNGAAWNRDPGESDPPIDPLVYYSLVPSSLYHAGNARQASDGTDMGADMNKIRQAFQSTIYTGCSNVSTDINYCGPTGPFPD